MARYVFPKWMNLLPTMAGVAGAVAPLYVVYVVAFGFSPQATDVGYQPIQPIPFSHVLHAGEMGIDCRYCHNTVEYAAKAAIPPTQTCWNCHANIVSQSPLLDDLRSSHETGRPVLWRRVHDLPDYAYFDHSAHITRGVSCVECHGRIDRMEVVYQHEMLSMGWCLDCHRDPASRLRDPALVTSLDWGWERTEQERVNEGRDWIEINAINPSENCSTCHR